MQAPAHDVAPGLQQKESCKTEILYSYKEQSVLLLQIFLFIFAAL